MINTFKHKCIAILLIIINATIVHALPDSWPSTNLVVIPFDDAGNKAQDQLIDVVDDAKTTLDISMYTFSDPVMVDHVIQAANNGVIVRVVKEKQVYHHDNNENDLKSEAVQTQRMIDAGIQVQGQSQRFLDINKDSQAHHKIIIVNGEYAIITTGNWDEATFKETRDFALAVTKESDPKALQEIINVFNADWENKPVETSCPSLIWSPDHGREQLKSFINSATKSIWIYQQSYNDPEICGLVDEKAKQGLDVRLVMMPYPFTHKKDFNTPFQQSLENAGGKPRFNLDYYIHAKTIIIDGVKSYVGTCNFYPSSIDFNREVGYINANPTFVNALKKIFSNDFDKAKKFNDGKDIKKQWG
jgi:cardiolipin synthase